MNIILFGPPGAGKGTQAKYLVKRLSNFQISTGDILREEIKNDSDIGKKIINNMNDGKFVDDEIVNKLLEKTIFGSKKMNKLIFDGYPRNVDQAKNLEVILGEFNQTIGHIIFLNVSRNIIEKRIMGRMTCEKCHMTMNEFFNKDQIDLHPCGKEFLVKRKDDNLDVVIARFDTYMKSTKPVLDFYSKNRNFIEIDGAGEIDQITRKINDILKV